MASNADSARFARVPFARTVLASALCMGVACIAYAGEAPSTALPELTARVDRGDFAGAQTEIDKALAATGTDADSRAAYLFQQERMRRIRLDFTLDESQTKAAVRKSVPDLRDEEFKAWDDAGLIEHLDIDGQRRWFKQPVPVQCRGVQPAAAGQARFPARPV